MTQQQAEPSPQQAEDAQRVRGYLVGQAAKRTPAQIVESVQQAHAEFLAALNGVPEAAFRQPPAPGEWSAADVLNHVRLLALVDEIAIPGAALRGEQPQAVRDRIEPAPADATRERYVREINGARERLCSAALAADPDAHLDVRWSVSVFGELNWREALLFARVHTIDHAKQMAAIAAAVRQQ